MRTSKNFSDHFKTQIHYGGNSHVMKYKNFEELPVWQAAIEFALKVSEFTDKADFRGFGDTKNQLERATVSISNNIAGLRARSEY